MNSEIKKPIKYKLVYLHVKRNNSYLRRKLIGWWTGCNWDGVEIRPTDEIINWEIYNENHYEHRTT